jgi:hypothetical protein
MVIYHSPVQDEIAAALLFTDVARSSGLWLAEPVLVCGQSGYGKTALMR